MPLHFLTAPTIPSTGIYTADNPYAYHDMHYGNTGLLVARIGGTIRTVAEEMEGTDFKRPFDHDSLRLLRVDARVNMTILRKSSQCLALAYFDGRILHKSDASAGCNRAINKFHLDLQEIIDRCFNGGRRSTVKIELPFRTVVATPTRATVSQTPALTASTTNNASSSRNRGDASQHAVIRYEAPDSLVGSNLEHGIVVGAWNESVTEETCPVCFLPFSEESEENVASINSCGHTYHETCLRRAVSFLGMRCCRCRVRICEPVGKMPSGTMRVSMDRQMSCAGFPKGTIVITYSIPDGVQKGYHVNPGENHCSTERTAFIPLVGKLPL